MIPTVPLLFMVPEPVPAIGVCLKVALLLALAGGAAALLRDVAASVRHLVWASALVGSLALAALTPVTPRVPVSVPIEFSGDREGDGGPAVAASAGAAMPASARRRGLSPLAFVLGLEILSTLWLAGAVGTGLWLVSGHLALAVRVRRARASGDPWLDRALAPGERQGARVLVSPEVHVPLTWGWARPVILLPAAAAAWPPGRVRAALLHERAHVARGDGLAQALASAACVMFWFNPLVWVAARRMRAESERACDDRVLAAGLTAPEYAGHLLAVAREAWRMPASLAAAGMARDSDFERRIATILDERRPRVGGRRWPAVAILLSFAIVLAPLSVLRMRVAAVGKESLRRARVERLTAAPADHARP